MTRPVLWSRAALDDLKGAASYIARENPEAAKKVAAAIREAGKKLGIRLWDVSEWTQPQAAGR